MRYLEFNHITESEAYCHCGCGLVSSRFQLLLAEKFIDKVGRPTPITSLIRCDEHNKNIGGFSQSPHCQAIADDENGACDLAFRSNDHYKKMVLVATDWYKIGIINNIELCDRHIHIAKVPSNHVLSGVIQPGKSKKGK